MLSKPIRQMFLNDISFWDLVDQGYFEDYLEDEDLIAVIGTINYNIDCINPVPELTEEEHNAVLRLTTLVRENNLTEDERYELLYKVYKLLEDDTTGRRERLYLSDLAYSPVE
jgi:hypothetical protein